MEIVPCVRHLRSTRSAKADSNNGTLMAAATRHRLTNRDGSGLWKRSDSEQTVTTHQRNNFWDEVSTTLAGHQGPTDRDFPPATNKVIQWPTQRPCGNYKRPLWVGRTNTEDVWGRGQSFVPCRLGTLKWKVNGRPAKAASLLILTRTLQPQHNQIETVIPVKLQTERPHLMPAHETTDV